MECSAADAIGEGHPLSPERRGASALWRAGVFDPMGQGGEVHQDGPAVQESGVHLTLTAPDVLDPAETLLQASVTALATEGPRTISVLRVAMTKDEIGLSTARTLESCQPGACQRDGRQAVRLEQEIPGPVALQPGEPQTATVQFAVASLNLSGMFETSRIGEAAGAMAGAAAETDEIACYLHAIALVEGVAGEARVSRRIRVLSPGASGTGFGLRI